MKIAVGIAGSVVTGFCLIASGVLSQEENLKTFSELISDGYEIKVVLGMAPILFLQKDDTAYVCAISPGDKVTLPIETPDVMEIADLMSRTLCDKIEYYPVAKLVEDLRSRGN